MKVIKKIYIVIGLVWISVSALHANPDRDSLFIDPKWHTLFPSKISDNGQWLLYYQYYPNNSLLNKAFVINTISTNTTELPEPKDFIFFADHMLIGKSDGDMSIYNLKTSKIIDRYSGIQNSDVLDKLDAICYLTDNGQLNILQYKKNKPTIIISDSCVKKYMLSPDKKQLLYLKENQNIELFAIDLESLKTRKQIDLEEIPAQVVWNIENTVCAIVKTNNALSVINLNNGKIKDIKLPVSKEQKIKISADFFLNNDLYISYNLKQQPQKEDEYLDIWNGNARDLHVAYKRELTPKAYVYQYTQEKLVELDRRNDREFLNINIPNHIISYNPFEFVSYLVPYEIKRFVLEQIEPRKKVTELSVSYNFPTSYAISPNNEYIIYPKEEFWELYNFKTQQKSKIKHDHPDTRPIWSKDSGLLYIQTENNLIEYNIKTHKAKSITDFKENTSVVIINNSFKKGYTEIDNASPILFKISHPNYLTSVYSYHNGKVLKIIDKTKKHINTKYLSLLTSKDAQTLAYTQEDYKDPPSVRVWRKEKTKILRESDMPHNLYDWRKQEKINYKDKYGKELTGVLYYPKNFKTGNKYPMVTYIYGLQGATASYFDLPILLNGHGYNQSLLTEQGYFVFTPDTYVSEEGPGLSSLECVTKGIDAITQKEPAIDKAKLGLIGHSFGGYQSNFIATQTDLFSAIICGAGLADLIWNTYEYNYYLSQPNYSRFETVQYKMQTSYANNPSKYIKNSPIFYAQDVNTPLLLWTGMKDNNVHWENTRHFYTALKRYNKSSIALFYKNVNHALTTNFSQEKEDLSIRVLDWFDYFLKDKKDIEWIKIGIDYNNY